MRSDGFRDLRNPAERPALRTYFTNVAFSEPSLSHALFDEGHEISNHTVTHDTGGSTTAVEWRNEIETLTDFLAQTAGIPAHDVVGFRAPYLATNEAMWQTLRELEFLSDSSVPEQLASPPVVSLGLDRYVWPHTMDFGLALSCYASHCPAETHRVTLDGRRLAPGNYFLALETGTHRTMRLVSLVR